jgi:hypothetical protein
MSEKYYCCSGKAGCGRLFIGSHPDICPDCNNTEFKQGIENLGFKAKQELAAHQRLLNNQSVVRQYKLKRKKP